MNAIKELLKMAEKDNPELYLKAKHELHEIEYGANFNEHLAMEDVSRFISTDMAGNKRKGEYWSINQVRSVYENHKTKLTKVDANVYDLYVALHIWYHDLSCNYKKRNPNNYENELIEDSITFFFCDEDAKYGKVWRYVVSML